MSNRPQNFEYYGDEIMSNFCYEVDKNIENAIKDKQLWAGYVAWNFFGEVWYADEKWHCDVKQYKMYVDTISAETPEELMEKVSDIYGYD
jgi:hypothetical protein